MLWYNYFIVAPQTACQSDGDVRLATNDQYLPDGRVGGRVELYWAGSWGTVCDSFYFWGTDEARVVCRQLGYSSSGEIKYFELVYIQLYYSLHCLIPVLMELK